MKKIFLAVALAVACGRAPQKGVMIDYRAPDGSFTARLPGDWKIDETPGETRRASFYGPPGGDRPYSQLIGVYFQPAADPAAAARTDIASEAARCSGPIREHPDLEVACDSTVPDVHAGAQKITKRTVAVVVPGGFFTLEYSRPAGAEASSVYDELLRTFRPGSIPK